jgi:transcriptional regulator with XRE-family HTH domain
MKNNFNKKEREFLSFNMRLYRLRKRITQKDFAKKCGTSLSTVGHIEAGTHIPSQKMFFAILKAMGQTSDLIIKKELESSEMK